MIFSRFKKYSFNPRNFINGSLEFVWGWISGRSLRKLALGVIPVGISIALLTLFGTAKTTEYRTELLSHYDALAFAALERGDVAESELFFSRTVSLAANKNARSFEIATLLYERGVQDRSLEILQGLAPMTTVGFHPAHEFLAEHYKKLPDQTDVTRAVAMFHRMHASGQAEEPRIQLAQFLSDRGYHQKAADCLKGVLHPTPQLRLQLVSIHTRSADLRAAEQQAKAAESELRDQLTQAPTNDQVRVLLSRATACQGRLLDAIFLLAAGCKNHSSAVLADELIKCYSIWLSGMSPEKKQRQLRQIALALEFRGQKKTLSDVTLHNGTKVSIPTAIVKLHDHVLKGEGQWLLTLLQGTNLAASEENYAEATTVLKQALNQRPGNAVIANNLAWAMLQRHSELTDSDSLDHQTELAKAWDLANTAVKIHPNEPEFRETRGQLASRLDRWEDAIEDLNQCIAMGHNSPAIQATLVRAKSQNLR